jgi:hypothetical protein
MKTALESLFVVAALTACGKGNEPDKAPKTVEPTPTATAAVAAPPAAPTAPATKPLVVSGGQLDQFTLTHASFDLARLYPDATLQLGTDKVTLERGGKRFGELAVRGDTITKVTLTTSETFDAFARAHIDTATCGGTPVTCTVKGEPFVYHLDDSASVGGAPGDDVGLANTTAKSVVAISWTPTEPVTFVRPPPEVTPAKPLAAFDPSAASYDLAALFPGARFEAHKPFTDGPITPEESDILFREDTITIDQGTTRLANVTFDKDRVTKLEVFGTLTFAAFAAANPDATCAELHLKVVCTTKAAGFEFVLDHQAEASSDPMPVSKVKAHKVVSTTWTPPADKRPKFVKPPV